MLASACQSDNDVQLHVGISNRMAEHDSCDVHQAQMLPIPLHSTDCLSYLHAGGAVQEDVAVGHEAHALCPAANLFHTLLACRHTGRCCKTHFAKNNILRTVTSSRCDTEMQHST